jgi:predicted nucleic acid-binding protein
LIAYFDTSALVSLFVQESRTAAVIALAETADDLFTSNLGKGEFAAAMSMAVRIDRLTTAEATQVLDNFDAWSAGATRQLATDQDDFRQADMLVRRFDLQLLFPDALHIALARRCGGTLVSGDGRQLDAARKLGLDVEAV